MVIPLGIRNKNPGNIRPSKQYRWFGEIGANGGFCVFDQMSNGIRALCKNLIAYYDNSEGPDAKYKSFNGTRIDTVEEAIYRWAPPEDHNDSTAYIAMVCSILECTKDDQFSFRDPTWLWWMVYAIAGQENGFAAATEYISDSDITNGVKAALL